MADRNAGFRAGSRAGSRKESHGLTAEKTASAHRALRVQFDAIEQALNRGDLGRAARLLNELIDAARAHFSDEEAAVRDLGLSSGAGSFLSHDAFVKRASSLMKRCRRTPANVNLDARLQDELVLLMSDLVEEDLRIEHDIHLAMRRGNTGENQDQ